MTALNGHNFGVGDNFNLERGVAPTARWAGFKVLNDQAGTGSSAGIISALDDLVALRIANNIKVANMSLGGPVDTALRSAVNNTVLNGVFVAVSQGNAGPGGTAGDPARAGLAMTVAAANAANRLTDYTTFGFSNGNTGAGEDTIKPDIMAPGGSSYNGAILSVDSNDADASDATFADQRANDYALNVGTSMASPFVAGSAALVIDAWQQSRHVWNHTGSADPLFVKMILCATATESGQGREFNNESGSSGVNNPSLGRAASPKDSAEGYGILNVDAAIECLTRPAMFSLLGASTDFLGNNPMQKRASGRNVVMLAGTTRTFNLTVPSGADFDLYLYSQNPGVNGNPTILASATSATLGGVESVTYTATYSGVHFLVVKRVSGIGALTLSSPNKATVLDLGAAPWPSLGLNDVGQVAGPITGADGWTHAYRTAPYSPINPATDDLGALSPPGLYHEAWGVNNAGQAVGRSQTADGIMRGFRTGPNLTIPQSATPDLGSLGGDYTTAAPHHGINSHGSVAGTSRISVGGPSHAFRTEPNKSIPQSISPDLGTLGGSQSSAWGINDLGQVIGEADLPGGVSHAFRTAPNSAINPATDDLGTLGGTYSGGKAINYSGQVAGNSYTAVSGVIHAFRTGPNQTIAQTASPDLGTLGGTWSIAFAINNRGYVVGRARNASGVDRAYFVANPPMIDLNTVLPVGSTWVLSDARDINNYGLIAGYGVISGTGHAFLLFP